MFQIWRIMILKNYYELNWDVKYLFLSITIQKSESYNQKRGEAKNVINQLPVEMKIIHRDKKERCRREGKSVSFEIRTRLINWYRRKFERNIKISLYISLVEVCATATLVALLFPFRFPLIFYRVSSSLHFSK